MCRMPTNRHHHHHRDLTNPSHLKLFYVTTDDRTHLHTKIMLSATSLCNIIVVLIDVET